MTTDYDIDWGDVDTLLTRLIDSADGYQNAAEHTDHTRFATMFRDKAQQRRQYVAALRDEMVRFGHTADDDGSLLAGAHRLFTNLRARLDDDDEGVLEEIERGEKKLIEEYRDALDDVPVDGSLHQLLIRQLSEVEADLATIRHAEAQVDKD